LQDEFGRSSPRNGQRGLDYAASGRNTRGLRDASRARNTLRTDDQALESLHETSRAEGIIPALESSHAVAECMVRAPKLGKDALIIVNLSGRGDKDVPSGGQVKFGNAEIKFTRHQLGYEKNQAAKRRVVLMTPINRSEQKGLWNVYEGTSQPQTNRWLSKG